MKKHQFAVVKNGVVYQIDGAPGWLDTREVARAVADSTALFPARKLPGAECLFGFFSLSGDAGRAGPTFSVVDDLTSAVLCRATVPVESWEAYYSRHIEKFPLDFVASKLPENGRKLLYWVTTFNELFCDLSLIKAPDVLGRLRTDSDPA